MLVRSSAIIVRCVVLEDNVRRFMGVGAQADKSSGLALFVPVRLSFLSVRGSCLVFSSALGGVNLSYVYRTVVCFYYPLLVANGYNCSGSFGVRYFLSVSSAFSVFWRQSFVWCNVIVSSSLMLFWAACALFFAGLGAFFFLWRIIACSLRLNIRGRITLFLSGCAVAI